MAKYKLFEDFLRMKHAEIAKKIVVKDYEGWRLDLDSDDWISLGEEYGELKKIQFLKTNKN